MTSDRGPLDIWLYVTHIAKVRVDSCDRFELTWTTDTEQRWGCGARLLSAKLGIGITPVSPLVRTYLDSLLPEGNARVKPRPQRRRRRARMVSSRSQCASCATR